MGPFLLIIKGTVMLSLCLAVGEEKGQLKLAWLVAVV
jgi:hypothetical protein